MLENPLHELIRILSRLFRAFWACHHAATEELRMQTHITWTLETTRFWGRFNRPAEAVRALADPALAWCSQKGFRDEDVTATVETAAHILVALATITNPRAMASAHDPGTAEVRKREGDQLLSLDKAFLALRKLAARTGDAWEPESIQAGVPLEDCLASPVKLTATCEALRELIKGAAPAARDAACASAPEIVEMLWDSMRRFGWDVPAEPEVRQGDLTAFHAAIDTVITVCKQKEARFPERGNAMTLEEHAVELGVDPSEIEIVKHPEAEALARWEAIEIVDGKFPPRWPEFRQMCEFWHLPVGGHNEVLSDIESAWVELLGEGGDEGDLLAYLLKMHGIAPTVAKKTRLADLAELMLKDIGKRQTESDSQPEAPTPAPRQLPSMDSKDMISVLSSVADENAVAILEIAEDTTKTTDQKMRAIYAIDNRSLGWYSRKWAKVLKVSDAAIRKAEWWKKDRPRIRDENR